MENLIYIPIEWIHFKMRRLGCDICDDIGRWSTAKFTARDNPSITAWVLNQKIEPIE